MKYLGALLILLVTHLSARATWSIVLVDPVSREIGIAGASCSYNCYGIGQIIPGKGAVVVQAMSNPAAREKGLAMLHAGASPQAIIAAMRSPEFEPENQQYAVVSLQYPDAPATYTGKATSPSGGYGGSLTAKGVSVQGNTLAGQDALKVIFEAVRKGQQAGLPLSEILMLALEAGSSAGGDKRCGQQRATSAFLIVAQPADKARKPYLDLQFFGQKPGGMNAVSLLRGKYEKWKSKQ